MTLQQVQLAGSKNFAYTDLNSQINHSINVNKGLGVAQVYLDIMINIAGSGTLTLVKKAIVGIISNLTVRDQNAKQLFSLNAHELIFMSTLLTQRPPFELMLYKDGTNGWQPVPDATTVVVTEEIRMTIALPVRLPQGHSVSKLSFEIFLTAQSTLELTHVLDAATTLTGVTGTFTPHVEYDDSINHSYTLVKLAEAIGTDFTKLGDLPEKSLMRYAIMYLDDFWEAHAGTTDDEWLFNEIEYQSAIGVTPIQLNRFSARHLMHDLLDLDPDFVLGDLTTIAYNLLIIPFPDVKIGANAQFNVKCDTTQDASLILVLVTPYAPIKEVTAFSPAGVGRLLKG